MFQNPQHHPTITQAQHRTLAAISNTDLSTLADELLGRPRRDCAASVTRATSFTPAEARPNSPTPPPMSPPAY